MSRAALPVSSISRDGVALASETTGDPTNKHTVPNNDGRMFLIVRNSNGGSTARVLTIHLPGQVDGQAVASRTLSVAAAATRVLGPFPVSKYGEDLLIDPDNAELKLSAYHLPES